MARIDKKDIKQRANQIDDAWKESAPAVEFKRTYAGGYGGSAGGNRSGFFIKIFSNTFQI